MKIDTRHPRFYTVLNYRFFMKYDVRKYVSYHTAAWIIIVYTCLRQFKPTNDKIEYSIKFPQFFIILLGF
jgi:hypothetical protein